METQLNFTAETTAVDKLFAEIESFKNKDSEFIELAFNAPDVSEKFFSFQNRRDTARGANNFIITLEPTDSFLDFMATLRARNLD